MISFSCCSADEPLLAAAASQLRLFPSSWFFTSASAVRHCLYLSQGWG